MEIVKKYNWCNQSERLVYIGKNWSGNGYWHQFALVSIPDAVWCECLDSDLNGIEETAHNRGLNGKGTNSYALPFLGKRFQ